MKLYELTYLISPDLSAEELKILQEKINSFIQEENGKLQGLKSPVRRKLAYPIKNKSEAYFTALDFYLLPEKLETFEKKLKKESKILRYVLLTKKLLKKTEIPQIIPEVKAPKVKKEKKVELEKIGEKLEEILGEI